MLLESVVIFFKPIKEPLSLKNLFVKFLCQFLHLLADLLLLLLVVKAIIDSVFLHLFLEEQILFIQLFYDHCQLISFKSECSDTF